ncbi:MAG: glutamate 5-kinase [Endomicrobium sp.]|jgi:glutamate 5-kinase|uniref:glutamate 5-kinase n=1 Tax=Candidatus Endomicrobiellum cubanum TaxID=3242325 RepID=UPI0028393CCF|nr:glutamate 5-kinase [Endomicrobium sp.]
MRIVIKVGTSTLTTKEGLLNEQYIFNLAKEVFSLREQGHKILIVSSGAVSAGKTHLCIKDKHKTLREKQAFAAVGQPLLMSAYSKAFAEYNNSVSQILLTRDVFDRRANYINVRNTLNTLIENDIIPIINENDSVSIDEINFGDNDMLSALVALAINADKLIIFTDVDGIYNGTLKASSLIPKIDHITEEIEKLTSSTSSSGRGTGGMKTKIIAAKIAAASGVETIITNGTKLNLLKEIVLGSFIGTTILASKKHLEAKKSWIAFSKKPKGTIFVDQKAEDFLLNKGKSLLAVGITKISGAFKRGDTINIANAQTKKDFARGLTNYDSDILEKVKGKKTQEIKNIVDAGEEEIIHRDNLVIISN